MSGEDSFGKFVSKWVEDNAWPQLTALNAPDRKHAILLFGRITEDYTVFKFHSSRDHLEVTALYHQHSDLLTSVKVNLVVPGYPKEIFLTGVEHYLLSDNDGEVLSFNVDEGIIKGNLTFKYVGKGAERNIYMSYSMDVPYAKNQKDVIPLSPTQLHENFPPEKLAAIPLFTPLELQQEIEKVLAYSASPTDAVSTQVFTDPFEQRLLTKHLQDFVVDDDKIVIETYYTSDSPGIQSSDDSLHYKVSVHFLNILELDGAVDPETLSVSASLFAKVPIAGRIRITNVQGSLGKGPGVRAEINAGIAKGDATFTSAKNPKGKEDLFVQLSLSLKFFGKVASGGKLRLLTLPF